MTCLQAPVEEAPQQVRVGSGIGVDEDQGVERIELAGLDEGIDQELDREPFALLTLSNRSITRTPGAAASEAVRS